MIRIPDDQDNQSVESIRLRVECVEAWFDKMEKSYAKLDALENMVDLSVDLSIEDIENLKMKEYERSEEKK